MDAGTVAAASAQGDTLLMRILGLIASGLGIFSTVLFRQNQKHKDRIQEMTGDDGVVAQPGQLAQWIRESRKVAEKHEEILSEMAKGIAMQTGIAQQTLDVQKDIKDELRSLYKEVIQGNARRDHD